MRPDSHPEVHVQECVYRGNMSVNLGKATKHDSLLLQEENEEPRLAHSVTPAIILIMLSIHF